MKIKKKKETEGKEPNKQSRKEKKEKNNFCWSMET